MSDQENENFPSRNGEHRLNRRGSMEIYRPGALSSNEEREKHRRRGHFGENKLPSQQQSDEPIVRRGQSNSSRRGGGFGRSRGRGVRELDRNGRDNDRNGRYNDRNFRDNEQNGRDNRNRGYKGDQRGCNEDNSHHNESFNTGPRNVSRILEDKQEDNGRDNRNGGYKGDQRGRNEDYSHHNEDHNTGPRNVPRILEDKQEDNGQHEAEPQLVDDFDINSPVKWTNWADDEYEEDTIPTPKSPTSPPVKLSYTDVRHPSEKSFAAPEPVVDLRDKLKAMRIDKTDQPHRGNQHFAKRNYQAPQYDQNFAPRPVTGLTDQYFSQRVVSPDGNRTQQRSSYGNNGGKSVAGNLPRPKRNTENFEPSFAPPEMRILCARPGLKHYDRPYSTRDVLVVNDIFCEPDDLTMYNSLLSEIENSGVDTRQLWQLWHGDSHVIADDKRKWKKECPTFHMVIDKIADYFHMDIKATRLNWYRDSTEWKPFHFDAAAVKADKARTQNFTVAISFGMERDAAFEHAKTKTIISMPQPNGTVYTFGRDVNILWRHGIPQVPPENYVEQGRISIIAWGWNEQFDL